MLELFQLFGHMEPVTAKKSWRDGFSRGCEDVEWEADTLHKGLSITANAFMQRFLSKHINSTQSNITLTVYITPVLTECNM